MVILSLFDSVIGKDASLNYKGCERNGVVTKIKWINGNLHYQIRWPDFHITQSGKKKPYFRETIYPDYDVLILNS